LSETATGRPAPLLIFPRERGWVTGALAVTLLAIGLRTVHADLMEFRLDSAFWALEGLEILQAERLPLAGQQVGSVNVPLFNGPALSYFVALFFALFGPSPIYPALAIGVLSGLAAGLTFWLGRHLYGNTVGLMAALFVACSPWLVLYSRMLWPQSLFPFLVPLTFFLLHHATRTRSIAGLTLWGGLIGICVQLHLSAVALLVAGLIFLVLYYRAALPFAAVFVGVAAGYLPIIAHDFLNGWPNALGLLSLSSSRTGQEETGLIRAAKWLWDLENVISGQGLWWSKLGAREAYLPGWFEWSQGLLWSALAILGVGTVVRVSAQNVRSGQGEAHPGDILLLLYVGVPLASLLLSGGPILRHYFLAVVPVAYLLVARGLNQLGMPFSRFAWSVASVCIAMNVLTNVSVLKYLVEVRGGGDYGSVLADKASAVDWIAKEGGTHFSVDVSDSAEPLAYLFLFRQQLPAIFDEARATISGPDSAGSRPSCRLIESGSNNIAASQYDPLVFGRVRIVQLQPGCGSGFQTSSLQANPSGEQKFFEQESNG
jgi:hypothetical protein